MSENDRLLDREWRLAHLYMIRDKDGKLVRFRKNRVQMHFDAVKHTRNLILKSRQQGFTTFECVDNLDETLFSTDRIVDADIIAHRDKDVTDIFDGKIQFAWRNFPEEMKQLWILNSESTRELQFGLFGPNSKTFNKISVTNSSRSGSKTRIHVSELAYLDRKRPKDAKEIISGCAPTLGEDGRWDIESTARGKQGEFYRLCMEAYERAKLGIRPHKKEFKLHFYHWRHDTYEMSKITQGLIAEVLPELKHNPQMMEVQQRYGYSDKEMTCYYGFFVSLGRDWELLKQEYPNTVEEAFEAKADMLFDSLAVGRLKEKQGRKSGDWMYFADYDRTHVYALAADVSEGIGRDSSAIVILDITKMEVAAVYASSRIGPDELAHEIAHGGRIYGECLVAPERNNMGHTTVSKLREIYPTHKIFRMKRKDYEDEKETDRLGWRTDVNTKPTMFHELRTAVSMQGIQVWDPRIKAEMFGYERESLRETHADPDQTAHFDILTALAIAYQMRYEKLMPAGAKMETIEASYR